VGNVPVVRYLMQRLLVLDAGVRIHVEDDFLDFAGELER
jgi:hypothetical protein